MKFDDSKGTDGELNGASSEVGRRKDGAGIVDIMLFRKYRIIMKSFLGGSELIPSAGYEDARRNIARSYFSTASPSHIPLVSLLSPLYTSEET